MFLFNKLIVIDLLVLPAVVLLFILKTGKWRDLGLGFATAVLIFSIADHFGHSKKTKKLY